MGDAEGQLVTSLTGILEHVQKTHTPGAVTAPVGDASPDKIQVMLERVRQLLEGKGPLGMLDDSPPKGKQRQYLN